MFGAEVAASTIQSNVPPSPPDSMTVTLAPGAAVVVFTDSVGLAPIVNVNDAEVPPPGAGVNTVTWAVPTAAMSAAPIAACSWVAARNVVARSDPFQRTTDAFVNDEPFTVSVNAWLPAAAAIGNIDDTTGTGAEAVLTVTVWLIAAGV